MRNIKGLIVSKIFFASLYIIIGLWLVWLAAGAMGAAGVAMTVFGGSIMHKILNKHGGAKSG